MSNAHRQIRPAGAGDAAAVADLAAGLAQSFTFSRTRFDRSYPALLATDGACVLLAVRGQEHLGYLLGFEHLTFYANGPVAWVEEVFVRPQDRGRGVGQALMSGFEQWATARDCALIALATRRAAPFYRALGFAESAIYHRKVLDGRNRLPPGLPTRADRRAAYAGYIVMGVAGTNGPQLYTIERPGRGRLSTMMRPPGFGALDGAVAALRAAGVDVLVSLLAEDEAEAEGLAYEAEWAKAHELTFYHLPTPDHHAPDRDQTAALARKLHGHLARGDSVVVHCWAGIGRSSTVAAATLLLEGYAPGAAWQLISAARGCEVPDQQSQRDVIDEIWMQIG